MFNPQPLHISLLEAVHPDYARHSPTWRSIETLIDGHTAVRGAIERFLPMRPGEDKELYGLRVAKMAYTPLMSSIVNRYVGKLASGQIVFDGDFDERLLTFRTSNNAPGRIKRNEKNLIGDIFRHLLQYATVWATVDTNVPEYAPQSLYEEELLAEEIRPFCTLTRPLEVTQWGDGWHITKKWQHTVQPFATPEYRMSYKYYDKDMVVEYEAEVDLAYEQDIEGNKYAIVKRVKIGDVWYYHSDKACIIPVARITYRPTPVYPTVNVTLPSEEWLCKQLYSKQIQHLQLETSWTDAGYLAGTIQRVFTPVPAPPIDDARTPYEAPDYTQELAKAGNAHIMIGAGYQFVESTGSAVANQQGMLDKIEQQMSKLAALHFASSNQGTLQQSGASKQLDMSLLDDTLRDYGDVVLSVYNAILDIVCVFLGVNKLDAYGLDEFDSLSLDSVVALIQTVGANPALPPEMLSALFAKMAELAKIEGNATSVDAPEELTTPTEE